MALVSFEMLRVKVREAITRRATITEQLDLSRAEVLGYLGVRGSYTQPALDDTVTLTTGNDPAAVLSWGDFPARAAFGVEISDPSSTIDPEADITHFPMEDPDNPDHRAFEFRWLNDPGADVDLDVTVDKFV